jgi:hypothetical protein
VQEVIGQFTGSAFEKKLDHPALRVVIFGDDP